MKLSQVILVACTLGIFISCAPKQKSKFQGESKTPMENGYSMIFFTLDNYALVYVDDSLAFDTRDENVSGKDEILYDLNPFVSLPNSVLKIEGYNTECNSCQVNNYEFVYEIYRDGEGIEYVSEYSNHKHQPVGLRLTREHYLDEL